MVAVLAVAPGMTPVSSSLSDKVSPSSHDITLSIRLDRFRDFNRRPMSIVLPRFLENLFTHAPRRIFLTTKTPHRLHQQLRLLSTTQSFKMADTNNSELQLSNLFDVKGKVALVTGGGVLVKSNSVFISFDTAYRIRHWPDGYTGMFILQHGQSGLSL